MKKLYTLMLLLATVAVSFTASAKSFTIVVDDASRVVVRNSLDGYQPIAFENNSFTVTDASDETYDFPVQANTGYEFVSAIDSGSGNSVANSYTTFPTDYFSLVVANVTDGGTVTITTREIVYPVLTLVSEDISLLHVEYGMTVSPADGKFTIPLIYRDNQVFVSIAEDKAGSYTIVSATGSDGTEFTVYNGCVYISASQISQDETVTITTKNLEEARTASMNVTVNGDPESVSLMRNGMEVSLTGATSVVKFDPEDESAFTVSHATYGKLLYKVTLGETELEAESGQYSFTATDGCNLIIDTEWPEIYAPVSFSFTNEGTEKAISSVTVDNENVDWQADDFKVRLGSTLRIVMSTNFFTISAMTLNGTSVNPNGYNAIIMEDTPLNFEITAEKKPGYKITFNCEEGDQDKFKVYNGYGYSESERISLTGAVTEFEIPQSYSYLTVRPEDGYIITALTDGAGNDLTIFYSNYLTADTEVFATIEKIERPHSVTVYVEPTDWTYHSMTLARGNNQVQKDVDLPLGYSTVNYGDFDLPINVGAYPTPVIYQNGEPAQHNYGELASVADGDVIKMFCNEPASYSVNYNISDEVNVVIEHDHANIIENPSTHTVLQGTEVVVSVAAEESPVAQVAARTAAPVVKVNDEIITPDTEGKYMFAVNADSNVSVEPGTPAGIDSIEAIEGGADAPVYNLQGIRVGKASDLRHLPAGLYISGGQKIRK